MKVWKVELNDLLEKIERHTSASLWRIRREFERSGLTFDRKFRKRFLRLTNNRLSETYDRVEIESLATDQRNRGQSRYNDEMDWNGRHGSVRRMSEDRCRMSEERYRTSEDWRRVSEDRESHSYPKKTIFWNECKERSLYSDRSKYVKPHRLSNIHKRLGKKIIPKNDDDDELPHDYFPDEHVKREVIGKNPFRSVERPVRSVAACPMPDSDASLSMDDKEMYPKLQVKVELSNSPKPSCSGVASKRKRVIESENDSESDGDVIEVPSKKQKIESISIDLDVEKDVLALNDMVFYCVHCTESNQLNDSGSGSVEDVYGHWLSGHTDLGDVKPFWFYVAEIVACFHCEVVDNFGEMEKHHQNHHPDDVFCVVRQVDRSKCAVCRFTGHTMIEHFATEHEGLLKSRLFNPARLPESLLSDLFAIDIHKKRQCGQCETIFETQHELNAHQAETHDDLPDFKEFCDNKSAYVICDHCSSKVDGTKFFNHIEKHQYTFKCTKCDFNADNLIDLVVHEKDDHRKSSLNYHCLEFSERLKKQFLNSKVVFGNGLVLTNHNFKNTIYDDSKQFDVFIERLVDKMKRQYNRMIGNHCNESKAVGSCRSQSVLSNASDAKPRPRTFSVDSHRNPFRVSSLNELENTQISELDKQNQLDNNLSIVGLPRLDNDDVLELFLKFCKRIQADVSYDDIIEIYRNGGVNEPVIVKFRNYDTKVMVKNCSHARQIWNKDLVKLAPGETAVKIFVNSHTTRYYGKMVSIAREARKTNSLCSYYLCKRGLAVRRTENTKERVVLSTSELVDYIYGNKKNNSPSKRSDQTSN